MAKDALGNTLRIGQKVMFNGMIYTIKDLQENRVLGSGKFISKGVSGMKIPDNITLEIDLPFDADKPFNGIVCQTPKEDEMSN